MATGVSTPTPALVCLEATDPDEETLTYEFELTRVRDGGVQLGSAVGVTGGWRADAGTPRPEVVFTTPALPENEWFRWRARAFARRRVRASRARFRAGFARLIP